MQINQTGEFLAQIPSNHVIIYQGQSAASFVIETANDKEAESDGKIVVEVLNGRNYQVDPNAHRVEIIVSDLADRERKRSEIISAANSVMIPRLTSDTGEGLFNVVNSRLIM